MDAACDATIAICTFNRINTLPQVLDSLRHLRGPYRFEVLVVNGPSDDGTGDYLETRDDIRIIETPELNLSISRNIAIANAAGRYIAFVDDDAVPEADWLTLLLDRFNEEPDLAALAGSIRNTTGPALRERFLCCDVLSSGRAYEDRASVMLLNRGDRSNARISSGNIMFYREPLMKIDGFDEVFSYFLDETDASERMADAGMRTDVEPAAEVHRKDEASHEHAIDHPLRNMYVLARSFAYFVLRHSMPTTGWEAATRQLQSLYEEEFQLKQEAYAFGRIGRDEFETLMVQIREGLLDGIDRFFDDIPPESRQKRRITRHIHTESTAVIRQMRNPESTLRLCMFSQDHAKEDRGGIGRWTNLAARGLAELGHEVTVLGELSDDQAHEYYNFTTQGFWTHNLRHPEQDWGDEIDCLGLPSRMASASKRKLAELRLIMPRRQFQVASTPIWDVEGAALIGAGDIPTVLSLHTSAGLLLHCNPEWREITAYDQNDLLPVIEAEKLALRRCQMILANSKAIMRDISELHGIDLFDLPHAVVPHGVDDIPTPEPLLKARIQARRAAGTPLRILFLGRLETRKGIAHLVPVLDALLRTYNNLVVDIVGKKVDDLNFKLVSGLLENHPARVTWHGLLADKYLDPLMRQSDILFGPSFYESFGLVYIEAMRYSIPCVAYATGGVTEVVRDGVDGFLAPLGRQQVLYESLALLIDNFDLRNRMSQSARQNFIDRFHYRLMANRLADVYREASRLEGARSR